MPGQSQHHTIPQPSPLTDGTFEDVFRGHFDMSFFKGEKELKKRSHVSAAVGRRCVSCRELTVVMRGDRSLFRRQEAKSVRSGERTSPTSLYRTNARSTPDTASRTSRSPLKPPNFSKTCKRMKCRASMHEREKARQLKTRSEDKPCPRFATMTIPSAVSW